jgi:hypothetical protein
MNEMNIILDSTTATSVFFYGSVLANLAFGVAVSWMRSAPLRRRARWLRLTAQAGAR